MQIDAIGCGLQKSPPNPASARGFAELLHTCHPDVSLPIGGVAIATLTRDSQVGRPIVVVLSKRMSFQFGRDSWPIDLHGSNGLAIHFGLAGPACASPPLGDSKALGAAMLH